MNVNRTLLRMLFLLSSFWMSQNAIGQVIWTGQGDGINWSDATNWNGNAVPLSTDLVVIGGDTSKVNFDLTSATIAGLTIVDSADLTLTIGTLTIDNQDAGTALALGNEDTLQIEMGAALTIVNATNGIEIQDGTAYLINSGTITLGPNLQYDGIWVNFDGRLHLQNTATGIIQTNYAGGIPNEGAFIHVGYLSAGYSTFTNEGTITGSVVAISAFYFDAPASIYNSGTIDFQFITQFPVFNLNFGSLLHNQNTGSITMTNYDDTGINLNFGSTFINDGIITSTDDAGLGIDASEAIDLDDANSVFVNNGTITITGNEQSESIELDGTFENYGFLNVGNASAFESIKARSGGSFVNDACGVVNITSNHLLSNRGIFTNDGILTTVFTGANLNLGLFTNNKTISTTDGLFNVTGNPITNNGAINTGPIPALSSECALTCPVFRKVLAAHSVGDTLLQASDSLQTFGTVQITATQTVTFQASQSVTLSPGFSAISGSNFVAKIAACQNNPVAMFQEMPIAALKVANTPAEKRWLKISPNPMKYDGQIEFYLPADSHIHLGLWNGLGQRVKMLHQNTFMNKGTHQLQLPTSGMEKGIYFLQLATSGEKEPLVKKLMIVD